MRRTIGCLAVMVLAIVTLMMVTIIVIGIFISDWFFAPVDNVYHGDHPELFSVAIDSVLAMRGVDKHWPSIAILEEDSYGRILFEYQDGGSSPPPPTRLVMQKSEGGYAYFYPHYNFVLNAHPDVILWNSYIPDFQDEEILNQWLEFQRRLQEMYERDIFDGLLEVVDSMGTLLEVIPEFSEETMARLKQENNWNQPLSDDSEFVRVQIVYEKETGPIPLEILVEVYHEFLPDPISWMDVDAISNSLIYLRTDNYGRAIYATSSTRYVILFQPDHSFDPETGILELTNLNNYQTELRLFMEANGWDTPSEIDRVISVSFPFQANTITRNFNIALIIGSAFIIIHISHKKQSVLKK